MRKLRERLLKEASVFAPGRATRGMILESFHRAAPDLIDLSVEVMREAVDGLVAEGLAERRSTDRATHYYSTRDGRRAREQLELEAGNRPPCFGLSEHALEDLVLCLVAAPSHCGQHPTMSIARLYDHLWTQDAAKIDRTMRTLVEQGALAHRGGDDTRVVAALEGTQRYRRTVAARLGLRPDDCPLCWKPALADAARFVGWEELGAGNYGDVWRARDTKMERVVAVKFVTNDRAGADALGHARSLAQANHDRVTQVYEVLDQLPQPDTGAVYGAVIMEYVDGETLKEHKDKLRGKPEVVRRLALDVLDGLVHLQGVGAAHGDLHVENVMVTNGRAKLIDIASRPSRSRAPLGAQHASDLDAAARLISDMLEWAVGSSHDFLAQCPLRTIDEQRRALVTVLDPGAKSPSTAGAPEAPPRQTSSWTERYKLALGASGMEPSHLSGAMGYLPKNPAFKWWSGEVFPDRALSDQIAQRLVVDPEWLWSGRQ